MATTRPAAQSTIIKRPRLTTLLDESEARILLFCAPAGYGKTTLAREWLATRTEPVAWYRGGIEMLDAAAVALALIEVLRGVGLSDDDATRLTARAARSNRPAELGRAIGSAVPRPSGAILAIDDYHHAESSESEALLGAFVAEVDLRILITSRTRPAWFAPRMQVYGEALVVGAAELAFTDDEANVVMADDGGSPPGSLVARARGWPAVIGLAARQKGAGPSRADSLLPAELYEYFADDLFRRASAQLHLSLFLLALAGGADGRVTQELLGDVCDAHLGEATERGFISRGLGLQFEMHPLLRDFLLARLHELEAAQRGKVVDRVLRSLGRARRWDDCLAVLDGFTETALGTSLLEEALSELLASGRIATVKRWLSLTPREGRESAVLLLAEAEVAVREGRDTEAQTIAEEAAELSLSSELAARAHLVAARAAHMRRDDAAARENAQRAAALTSAPDVRADARWLEFVNAYETEDEGAREILELLCSECDNSPEQALRLRNARGCVALEMDGDIRQSLRLMEPGMALLDRVSNPLARTSFLNFMSTAYLYLCNYGRCLELVDRHITDARTSGLDFATDHALVIRASALIGQRRLGYAQRILQELQSRSVRPSPHVVIEARMQASRLRAAAGDLERAEVLLRDSVPEGVSKASRAEVIASRALYLSAMGDLPAARLAIREAAETSRYARTRGLNDFADAIVSLQEASDVPSTARSNGVVARAIQFGQLDSLVLACRVYPRLAKSAAVDETVGRELTNILASSNDVDIGRSAGLTMPRELRRTAGLSKRELEVYELVAQGRSNREIAKALFISESTTKVHVRHIFEKLKVRTRAEAAAMAIGDDR